MDIEALRTSAKQYGYDISDDGAIIAPSGNTLSVKIIKKNGKLHAVSAEQKLATFRDESLLGSFFLERFYYAEKVKS